MSSLPEKGEVRAAAAAMNERMLASTDGIVSGETFDVGAATTNRETGELAEAAFGIRSVYGDLFDVGEMMAQSAGVIELFLVDIACDRRDALSAMMSLYLQAAGHGVIMERQRWERRDG